MSNSPSTYWGARPTLDRIAAGGMLVCCRCLACRKVRTYLASDLVHYLGAHVVVGELFNGCPSCGSRVNWRERYRYPSTDDVLNGLIIRKLKGFRQVAVWADEPFQGEEQYGPPRPGPRGASGSAGNRDRK